MVAAFDNDLRSRYSRAFAWFLANQNGDGSWGSDKTTRVTYTSQAIQLLLAADYQPQEPILARARRWLDTHAEPGQPHWLSRVEVGLLLQDYSALARDKYIHSFMSDLTSDLEGLPGHSQGRMDFFWHGLPTLIALVPWERPLRDDHKVQPIPYEAVSEALRRLAIEYRNDCITVLQKPNHTGLAMVYLATVAGKDGQPDTFQRVEGMHNWIVESRVKDDGLVYWSYSRGVTAYVLMDLLRACEPLKRPVLDELRDILRFLFTDQHSDGALPGDRTRTYETSLHSESLYATILSLRAAAAALTKFEPATLQTVRVSAERVHVPVSARVQLAMTKRRKHALWAVPLVAVIVGLVLLALDQTAVATWFLSGGMGALFTVFAATTTPRMSSSQ